jgi:hypothetical protein
MCRCGLPTARAASTHHRLPFFKNEPKCFWNNANLGRTAIPVSHAQAKNRAAFSNADFVDAGSIFWIFDCHI